MRQNIIITLILLIFLTGCGATAEKTPINPESEDKSAEAYSDSKTKLIEIESELVPEQGLVQICAYNDDFIDQGIDTQYTFIDIIKDNETKATINTHHQFSEITDIDCFDYSNDEEKDIAVIGKSDSYTTVFLCETASDYYYTDFYPQRFCGDFVQESLGNDFSMSKLKSILLKEGVGSLAKILINDAEKVTYSDYKSAYINFLKVLDKCGVDEYGCSGGAYSIYDIDKDSIPELIVHYGDCGANLHAFVFTYTDNKVKCIDEIGTGHSEFYAYPSGNGILQSWAHMGGEEFTLFSLNNNELTAKELYSGSTVYEDPETGEYDIKFTPERDVVPDTYFLTSFVPDNVFPIEKYETISAYVPSQDNANYTFPDNNPKFYSEIMEKDNIVNAVSKYRNDPVYKDIHFSDFLKKLEHSPSEIHDITYADLNLDNVYECIFYVLEKDSKDSIRIILSKQGDDIYAYYDSYYMASTGWGEAEKTDITENGFFIEEPNEHFFQNRVMYDKEKWFYYSAPY